MAVVGLLAIAASWDHQRTLAFQAGPAVRSQFAWFDRTGRRVGSFGDLADYGTMELSPDGTRLAVAVLDDALGTRDIWVYDVASGRRTQFTSDPEDENWLIWSPDGRRAVFNRIVARRDGSRSLDLFQAPTEGGGREQVLLADAGPKWPVSWSPDGRNILYVTSSAAEVDTLRGRMLASNNDIWVLPLTGNRTPYPLLRTPAQENWPAFSPDGKWIAYAVTEVDPRDVSGYGRQELYVMQFPPTGLKWQVSSGGGFQARWRRDGKELFYLTPQRTLVAATVSGSGSDFEVSTRETLFETRFAYAPYRAYDVSADGQRILVNTLIFAPVGPSTNARLLLPTPRTPAQINSRGPASDRRSCCAPFGGRGTV